MYDSQSAWRLLQRLALVTIGRSHNQLGTLAAPNTTAQMQEPRRKIRCAPCPVTSCQGGEHLPFLSQASAKMSTEQVDPAGSDVNVSTTVKFCLDLYNLMFEMEDRTHNTGMCSVKKTCEHVSFAALLVYKLGFCGNQAAMIAQKYLAVHARYPMVLKLKTSSSSVSNSQHCLSDDMTNLS